MDEDTTFGREVSLALVRALTPIAATLAVAGATKLILTVNAKNKTKKMIKRATEVAKVRAEFENIIEFNETYVPEVNDITEIHND